jgi:hypothetical protein
MSVFEMLQTFSMPAGRRSKDTQVQGKIATADCLVFHGDMMQRSKVVAVVVRNVKEAVNARRLPVNHPRM